MGEPRIVTSRHLSLYLPSSDPTTPKGILVQIGGERFLFAEDDGTVSPDSTVERHIEECRRNLLLPPGGELKVTKVPSIITYGPPELIALCQMATCRNFNRPVPARGGLFCGYCGERLSLQWVAAEK